MGVSDKDAGCSIKYRMPRGGIVELDLTRSDLNKEE
jgi:hypothetical protein